MTSEEIKSKLQESYILRDQMMEKYDKVLPEQDSEISELEKLYLEDVLKPQLERYKQELMIDVRFNVEIEVKRVEDYEYEEEDDESASFEEPNPQEQNVGPSRKVTNHTKGFKVVFPDGTSFCENNAIATFIATLRHIGFERVSRIDLTHSGYNLVSRTKRPVVPGRIWQHECDGWYIYTNSNNQTKIDELHKISSELGLQLVVSEC